MPAMDFYITLGLRPGATTGDIKRAYRRLARRYHPNINPGDQVAATRFQQIVVAYETLIDPERRQRYDTGEAPAVPEQQAGAVAFAFEGFDFSVTAEGPTASTFGDLFADVIRAAVPGSSPAAARGVDLHGDVHITFDGAMHGASAHLTVTRLDHCHLCGGGGRVQAQETRCAACEGTGQVKMSRGHMLFSKPCGACRGAGVHRDLGCPACRGEGVGMHSESITVQVPPGINDGDRLRLAGHGNAGRHGAPSGDLYVTVRVAPHKFFRREGDHLHVEVPVALHEAALGARIDVPTPSGPCKVKIPPGTQSGQQFRVRERGAPSMRGGPPGDVIVTTRLVLPRLTDERSKDLIRELARLNPEDVRQDLGV
jgi:molecular chaperone DnaJ